MKTCIRTPTDVDSWRSSQAYYHLLETMRKINDLIVDIPISASPHTPLSEKVCAILEELESLIQKNPPQPMSTSQRYGNPAFRRFISAVSEVLPQLLTVHFGTLREDHREELSAYIQGSLGNSVRIDYGTGHELFFLAFIAALKVITIFNEDDHRAMGLQVMAKYLHLVRRLQIEYSLEPAGSHGVWGLDDYQFVPFLWGSSQLRHKDDIPPDAITRQEILTRYAGEFHYLDAISFILQIKRGGCFWEHSPVLYDISGIPSWDRVNCGLWRMYQEEVLGKFPVIQHFEFGSILSWERMDIL